MPATTATSSLGASRPGQPSARSILQPRCVPDGMVGRGNLEAAYPREAPTTSCAASSAPVGRSRRRSWGLDPAGARSARSSDALPRGSCGEPGLGRAEASRHSPLDHALAAADAVARRAAEAAATTNPDPRRLRTLSPDDAVANMRYWSGVERSRWVVQYADPCAETPIESLGRFVCLPYDLPMPVANAWVGELRPEYRVDGLWPWHWAAFEADGAVKYNLRPDASDIVAAQVAAQNEREWWLRRLGLDFARFGWELAAHRRPSLGPVEPETRDWPTPLNRVERIPRRLLPPRRRRYG